MKTLLITLCVAILASCSNLPPATQTQLRTELEQFVIAESVQYFAGTLTEQQIIDAARVKFTGLALSEVVAVVESVLSRPSVVKANTPH